MLTFTPIPKLFPTDAEVWKASDGQQTYFTSKGPDGWKSVAVPLSVKAPKTVEIGSKFASMAEAQAACELFQAAPKT